VLEIIHCRRGGGRQIVNLNMSARVHVSIVTYNSARFIAGCLESLKSQSFQEFKISVWDNASTDETVEVLSRYTDFIHTVHFSNINLGFCAAHNRIILETGSDYLLVLNPDVVLEPDFLAAITKAIDADPRAGSATGRLWRWDSEDSPSGPAKPGRIIDSTGIYFTPNQRHFDRGGGEVDNGQYTRQEYVFGASGAASFYRRSMLEDIRLGNHYFDEDFFAYREDADLSWRARWMGWECLYVPQATAFHWRRVLPERRSKLPAAINMHSFKNRFLLRIKNMDGGTYLRFFFPITLRDLAALAYVAVKEWSSLPAFGLLLQAAPRAWAARRAIQSHRRAAPEEIRSWFSNRPVSRPAP
jgi:GT2 family glycosyltransferase